MFNIPAGINNRGQITGQSDLPGDATHHAFLWNKGVMADLGTLPGYGASAGNGINNGGQIVGFGDNGVSQIALIWEAGVATDLNTLIPPNPNWFLAEALSINDRGEITGFAFSNSTGYVETFVLTPCDGNRRVKGCDEGNAAEILQQMQLGHRYKPQCQWSTACCHSQISGRAGMQGTRRCARHRINCIEGRLGRGGASH